MRARSQRRSSVIALVISMACGLVAAVIMACFDALFQTNQSSLVTYPGIGVAVGWSAWVGNLRQQDIGLALMTLVTALACMTFAQWLSAQLISRGLVQYDGPLLTSYIADVIVEERLEMGVRMARPDHTSDLSHYGKYYVRDVWHEAQRRWSRLSPSERDRLRMAPQTADPQFHLVALTIEEAQTRGEAVPPVNWPFTSPRSRPIRLVDFAEEARRAAIQRWEGMTPVEQDQFVQKTIQFFEATRPPSQPPVLNWIPRIDITTIDGVVEFMSLTLGLALAFIVPARGPWIARQI